MSTIVVMPGGFHPFHAGHYALYKSAVEAFPEADVYVAATNSQEERPFPFSIKEKLAQVAGVKPGHFIQVKSPFQPREITDKFNPQEDVLIFVRSEKDKNESPKPGGIKKDGSPAYFQPYTGKDLVPFGQHAYIAYLPTVKFGPGITSATEIRKAWPTLDEKRKTAMVMSLYPAAQKNAKLAKNIVQMLDIGMGGQSLAEGFFDRFKKKHPEPNDPRMMPAFHAAGGYEKNLDVMAWQLGWKFSKNNPGVSGDQAFQKLYYGGGSPFPFDEKTFKMAWDAAQDQQVNEFAPGGNFKPPATPKGKGDDPWGDDDRSKIGQAVKQLLAAGNKVDWRVPGQMGHVVRVNDDGVTMKRWGVKRATTHYFLPLRDDRDDRYQIMMKAPGHYEVVSSGLEEGIGSKLAAGALASAMALGGTGADAKGGGGGGGGGRAVSVSRPAAARPATPARTSVTSTKPTDSGHVNIITSPAYFWMPGNIWHNVSPAERADALKKHKAEIEAMVDAEQRKNYHKHPQTNEGTDYAEEK